MNGHRRVEGDRHAGQNSAYRLLTLHLLSATFSVDGRRSALSSKVDDRTIRRYECVLSRRDGRAVVTAHGGKCTGCQMKLPPQLFILVQRGHTLESCPACQRFLYFVPVEDVEA